MESRQVGVTLEWLHPKARGALQRYLNLPSPLSFPIVYSFKSPMFFENVCSLYFAHRQHPQNISLLRLHLLAFLMAESAGMNSSDLDLRFGLLLSSSESYTSQIMSLHFSCSCKCHCLTGFLGEQHISTTCTTLAILQLLAFTTTNSICVLLCPFFFPSVPKCKDPQMLPFAPLPSYFTIHMNDFPTFKTSPL